MPRSCLLAMLAICFALRPELPLAAQEARTKLDANGWGSLKGKVIFEGKPPKLPSPVAAMKMHDDARCCLMGSPKELINPTWIIDPKTKGLANVVIWLKPPAGQYFPIHADD